MRRLLVGALVLAVSVAASACSSGDKNLNSDGNAGAVSTTAVDNGVIDNAGVSGVLVGGGSFVLDDALATQPVALWFWAPG